MLSYFDVVTINQIYLELCKIDKVLTLENRKNFWQLFANQRINRTKETLIKSLNKLQQMSIYLHKYQIVFTDKRNQDFFHDYFEQLIEMAKDSETRSYLHWKLKEFQEQIWYLLDMLKQIHA